MSCIQNMESWIKDKCKHKLEDPDRGYNSDSELKNIKPTYKVRSVNKNILISQFTQ